MKKSYFIILLIFISCVPDQNKVPEDVIGINEMANLLLEIHLLEAKVGSLDLKPDSTRKVYKHYEKLLFTDFGIDSIKYNRSLEFYMDHMRLYERVYIQVIDSLMVLESKKPESQRKSSRPQSIKKGEFKSPGKP